MQFGNPLVSTGPFTYGQLDFLGQAQCGLGSVANLPNPGTPGAVLIAANPYTHIILRADNSVAFNPLLYCAVESVNIDLPGNGRNYIAEAFLTAAGNGNPDSQCIIPCDISPGDNFSIQAFFTAASPGALVEIWGATGPCPVPMRSDGYAYPIGRWRGTGALVASAGPVTLANPAGNLRALILSANLSNDTAGTFVRLQVTVNGTVANLLECVSADSMAHEWPQGINCDPGTSVTISGSAAATACANIQYDIVG